VLTRTQRAAGSISRSAASVHSTAPAASAARASAWSKRSRRIIRPPNGRSARAPEGRKVAMPEIGCARTSAPA